MKRVIFIYIVINLIVLTSISSQDRVNKLSEELQSLSNEIPALNSKVKISLNDIELNEFIRAIANNVGLNVSIDRSLTTIVSNNFTDVKVVDILIFLIKKYNLTISNTGGILHIEPYVEPITPDIKPKRDIRIRYDKSKDLISFDLRNDTLQQVARKITNETGKNVILFPGIENKTITMYLKDIPFETALEKLAETNNLMVDKTDDLYTLSDAELIEKEKKYSKSKTKLAGGTEIDDILNSKKVVFNMRGYSKFDLFANKAPIEGIVRFISDSLKKNYIILCKLDGQVNLNLYDATYKEFLNVIFKGTSYNYTKENDILVIGKASNLEIIKTKTIKMENRIVEGILSAIPENLLEGIIVKEINELNSLFVSGSENRIRELEKFVFSIDQVIPLIQIEIIILDVKKNINLSTGISAGMGENPNPSAQKILPGVDYQLSSSTLNNIVSKLNGEGWTKFQNVSPDFYLSIKALEDNGILKIRSTPKLSTLNGQEATLTSGETKFYKEERSSFIGTQNPTLASSATWKAINADLSIIIRPIVSGNDEVTLNIEVEQSEFTPREFEGAPPGSVTRNFKSIIRMKNGEMVLLGGLDKISTNKTSSGVPLLSRIPVLKWIFSSNVNSKSNSKLNIFIMPTIIY